MFLVILQFSRNATAFCQPLRITGTGFDVNYYGYDLLTDVGWSAGYFSGGYKDNGYLGSIQGVININFNLPNVEQNVVVNGLIYGYDVPVSNFSMDLTGYFQAPATGTYTFSIYADDGVGIQFGNGIYCCDDVEGALGNTSFVINPVRGAGGSPPANTNSFSVQLQAGAYYPMKLVFFDWNGPLQLRVNYIDPLGAQVLAFNNVVQAEYPNEACYVRTTTTQWTGSFTLTSTQLTTYTSDGTIYSNAIINIEVPMPTETTTKPWSGTFTSTYTTFTTVINDSTTYTEHVVVVEIPTAGLSTTTVT